MNINKKLDRRKKYYLILDCETATLPTAMQYNESQKQKIAIAKPLIYDLAWQVVDRLGNVYRKKSFLISEIFSVPQIFNTAYYAHKRPLYLERLKKGETVLTDWQTATAELVEDMQEVQAVGAYNSMFDFKKAIPFTELYINMLYSPNYYKWEKMQNEICKSIAEGDGYENKKKFEQCVFRFRGQVYDLFDVWGLSCEYLLNNDNYRKMCIDNGWETASGKYFKTSAETCYRFVMGQTDFDEMHIAIDDAEIESEIFALICKKSKNKFEMGIEYFPFRILGRVEHFIY